MKGTKELLKAWAPEALLRAYRTARRHWRRARKDRLPLGWRMFGSLRRLRPIRRHFGWGHGTPVDRYYVERFLERYRSEVRGKVLEVGDRNYTRRFGGGSVSDSEVLHVEEGHPEATIVGDLSEHGTLEADIYDCAILTFVLGFVFDVRAALGEVHRALKPGGVLLVADSGIRSISRYDQEHWGDYWRFTSLSLGKLLGEEFRPENVEVEGHGNVLAAVAFLHGILAEELTEEELEHSDDDYELVVTARARKTAAARSDGLPTTGASR